jgi:protease II
VLFFDCTGENKTYEIVIKDLESGKMMPCLIQNASDEVAFDFGAHSFYYVELGPDGKGTKVRKH